MDEDLVLSTLLETIDVPRKSLSIRYIHTLEDSGAEGCSVVNHTADLGAHPLFLSSMVLVIHWLKCVSHGCLKLIP